MARERYWPGLRVIPAYLCAVLAGELVVATALLIETTPSTAIHMIPMRIILGFYISNVFILPLLLVGALPLTLLFSWLLLRFEFRHRIAFVAAGALNPIVIVQGLLVLSAASSRPVKDWTTELILLPLSEALILAVAGAIAGYIYWFIGFRHLSRPDVDRLAASLAKAVQT